MKLNRYQFYLIAYVFVAFTTAFFSKNAEVRPIFNGHWFVKTPYKISDFGLLIVEIDGKKKDPAIYFDRSANLTGKAWSYDRYNLAQKIAEAYLVGNDEKFESAISLLKAHLNRISNIKFILQKRNYDPKDYIRSGSVTETKDLKTIALEFP